MKEFELVINDDSIIRHIPDGSEKLYYKDIVATKVVRYDNGRIRIIKLITRDEDFLIYGFEFKRSWYE